MSEPVIRGARLSDASRLLEIYAYYVEETAITFECAVPTLEAFQKRIETTLRRYPYLVLEQDGVVQGYAYAGPLNERAAYDWACELSVYLDRGARGHGFGRRLHEAMEARLKDMGILNLYGCIAYPETEDERLTRNSAEFHEHLGFQKVGELHSCGYKFGRWYHILWMEKTIGEHRTDPPSVRFPG